MQSALSHNINQYCYYGNQSIYISLDKVSNYKDSKIKKFKLKAQELMAFNLNNFSRLNLKKYKDFQ